MTTTLAPFAEHTSATSNPSRPPTGLVALCGILGVVALGIYYSVPLPLPAPDATTEQVVAFGQRFHDRILLDGWLQAIGTLLCGVNFVGVVFLARGFERLWGWVALLGVGSVLAMSLLDVVLVLGSVQAAALGHVTAAIAFFDLTFVFVHVFPIVPAAATFAGLGGVLLTSDVLPRGFAYAALLLAAGFGLLGLLGLFVAAVNGAVVVLLTSQELWILGVVIALVRRARRRPFQE